MLIIKTIAELNTALNCDKFEKKIGLVPTMGAIHQGHVSLIKRATKECDRVVVSIFVNALQFSPTEDLTQYPHQLATDSRICGDLGVDILFCPTEEELGIVGDTTTQKQVTIVKPPQTMTAGLCAKYRPDHFTGVATIVTKLLNIVQPNRAYFGEKDAQQLAIIHRLVKDLNLSVEIIACPIIREASGLALSSRNQYLSAKEKSQATVLYRSLQQAVRAFLWGENKSDQLIKIAQESLMAESAVKIQYIELVDPVSLEPLKQVTTRGLLAIAAYLGHTRLIDNIILRQPIIAIDGPAGAGKSTVTRRVAEQLGLLYLDTGAMYRAVTWLVMDSGISVDEEQAIANLVKNVTIDLIPTDSPDLPLRVKINAQDVTQVIRTPQVTANVSTIAAQAAVRQQLVKAQQLYGKKGGIIAEGRDIGTNVYPDADLKIFLTASVQERARRRSIDLQNQGQKNIDLSQLEQDIATRDEKDSNRAISPLQQADDAIEIVTDSLTIEEVIAKIVALYHNLYR